MCESAEFSILIIM